MSSRRCQDIPIRPRYGYLDCSSPENNDEAEMSMNPQTTASTTSSSYKEIPFLAQYPGPVPPEHIINEEAPTASRAMSVNKDLGDDDELGTDDEEEYATNFKENAEMQSIVTKPPISQYESTFSYELEGDNSTGEMRHFVAHNLEAKLREGSAQQKGDYSLASENTTPSTSSGVLTRRFLQSHAPPAVDGNVLGDIELEAQYLATSVDNLMDNLGNLLHSISSITADNVEMHKNAVNKLTDSMDANIKCMYTIMAKTEEITKSIRPTEQLGQRIREIKRLVDMLDNTM